MSKLARAWHKLHERFWSIPALMVVGGAALATTLLHLEHQHPHIASGHPFLFAGGAESARTLLQAVSGSLVTVVTLAFSITIVAIQQAATQFSPRVIRNFLTDRANRVVLGAYVATFTYTLLVLRQVRGPVEGGAPFVPALSITVGVALVLVCITLLIYFFHHVAESLQASTIVDNIWRATRRNIQRLYPECIGRELAHEPPPPSIPGEPPTVTVSNDRAGFLNEVLVERLLGALEPHVTMVRVRAQVGTFLFTGAPLVDLWLKAPVRDEERLRARIRSAFLFGKARTLEQDALFGIRQLVDVALKALSPGINDPTTAEHSLWRVADLVATLSERVFPMPWRYSERSGTLLLLPRPDFADVVNTAFGQIRRAAAPHVHVVLALLDVMAQIAPHLGVPERAEPLRREVEQALASARAQPFTAFDRARIEEQAARAFKTLDHPARDRAPPPAAQDPVTSLH